VIRPLFVLLLLVAPPALADPEGRVHVIDGDTFDVGQTRVRLHGIDAPEIGQPCLVNGQQQDCGRWVRDAVRLRFEGRQASCLAIELDRYGRTIASCTAAGEDMGAVIVGEGWAWAYRRYSFNYDLDEKSAAVAGRGLWSMTIDNPEAYRATRSVLSDSPPPDNCTIKGNISSNGRIYHLPGSDSYDRTRIDTNEGERWFCSISEAEAAGWRAARRP
jgi:endonuclease YncB( thermonuclease family)